MKISVVMATYNGARFIVEQLDSIRLQTRKPDELLIRDDCSTDNTMEIVTNYIDTYKLGPQWHIVCNPVNLGFEDNFARGAEQATGDIIFFADQDDIWQPRKLQQMTDLLEQHPQWNLLSCDYSSFFDSAPNKPVKKARPAPNDGSISLLRLNTRDFYLGSLGCCMAVRSRFLRQITPYQLSGWAHDDRLWKLGICSGQSYLLHSNLVCHRLHGNNAATGTNYHGKAKRSRHFYNQSRYADIVLNYLTAMGAPERDQRFIRHFGQMMALRAQLISQRKWQNAWLCIKYLPYFEKKKSWLVDLYAALQG